jgi:hypothetical protein
VEPSLDRLRPQPLSRHYNFDGLTVIEFSTITNNTAPDGFGSGVASFGDTATRTEVLSSIISAKQGTDVDFVSDTTNSFLSGGFNVIGSGNAIGDDDPNTDDNAFDQTGDNTGVSDPGLDPLDSYGGPTQTHRLQSDSPALDAATRCPPPATDQRGVERPQGPACDIGAYEVEVEVEDTTPPTVTNTTPDGTVSRTATVTATFDEDVQNVTSSTFILERKISVKKDPPKFVLVDATVDLNTDGSYELTPVQDLPKGTYCATITTGVTDLADNALEDPVVWTFTVAN